MGYFLRNLAQWGYEDFPRKTSGQKNIYITLPIMMGRDGQCSFFSGHIFLSLLKRIAHHCPS